MIKSDLEKAISQKLGNEFSLQSGARFGDFFISPSITKELMAERDLSGEDLSRDIFESIKDNAEKVVFEGGYINVYLSKKTILEELLILEKNTEAYFAIDQSKDKTIVFDYSGPNIAKPFSVGHLRSTVIGQANYNIHKLIGYHVVGVNHIGDWGTQFGKLIYAIKTWGNEDEIAKDPIASLNALYVRFHKEAEDDESLNECAREWFKKLEDGDEEARRLWQKCIDWSMSEFKRVYKIIGVNIDNTQGESFYSDKLDAVIQEIKTKGLLKESEGAFVVELDDLPPALIQKKDLATLYLTRDLAALKYRLDTFMPTEIIYHVGNDQSLHFRQLAAVATKLGWLDKTQITFAGHGLIKLETGKMSTRKGQVILLDDIINEAKQKALNIINQKNPDLKNHDETAMSIAVSAIKYSDLVQNRKSDIVFSFDKVVTLKGNSGPYLQYTYARAASILRKLDSEFPGAAVEAYLPEEGIALARHILGLRDALIQAARTSSPNIVCDFTFKLCEQFNGYYETKKIVTKNRQESSRNSYLVLLVQTILGICFETLALDKLDEI